MKAMAGEDQTAFKQEMEISGDMNLSPWQTLN
jgi:hypothetical protein